MNYIGETPMKNKNKLDNLDILGPNEDAAKVFDY